MTKRLNWDFLYLLSYLPQIYNISLQTYFSMVNLNKLVIFSSLCNKVLKIQDGCPSWPMIGAAIFSHVTFMLFRNNSHGYKHDKTINYQLQYVFSWKRFGLLTDKIGGCIFKISSAETGESTYSCIYSYHDNNCHYWDIYVNWYSFWPTALGLLTL